MGDAIVSELHGRYYEAAYRRSMFSGANQAAVALSAAFALAYTGLCLSNPIGSTVNLVLNKATFAQILAQTTTLAVGLMVGYNGGTNVVHTTPLVPGNNYAGGAAPVGLLDAAATLPTAPTLRYLIGEIGTAAITAYGPVIGPTADLEGSIVIPPGGYVCLYANAASVAASILASFQWEEVPV
jgi:hypothetical protein